MGERLRCQCSFMKVTGSSVLSVVNAEKNESLTTDRIPDIIRVNSIIAEIPCNNYARTFRTTRTSSFWCSFNPGWRW